MNEETKLVVTALLALDQYDAQKAILAYCEERNGGVGEELLEELEAEYGKLF